TVVDFELQEDWNGLPSGRVVAGGRATLSAVGVPAWATVTFDSPPVLDANPYWLAAHATQGSAVWLTQPDEAELRALRANGVGGWDAIGAPNGRRAVHRFYSRVPPEDERPGGSVSVAGRPVQGAALNGSSTYDIAAALVAAFAGVASGPVSV